MYARCTRCDSPSRLLVDTDRGTTETRCETHAEDEGVELAVNHKRNPLPLSEGGSGTSFRASCDMCGDDAYAVVRFEDGMGVITTEARCREHLPTENETLHTVGDIGVKAQDL